MSLENSVEFTNASLKSVSDHRLVQENNGLSNNNNGLSNNNNGLSNNDKLLDKSESLLSDEKAGTHSVHLKNTTDSAVNFNDVSGFGGKTLKEIFGNGLNAADAIKVGRGEILGRIYTGDYSDIVKENQALESGGFDRKHDVKKNSMTPPVNNNAIRKLESVSINHIAGDALKSGTNGIMADEINAQNSILNSPSSQVTTSGSPETSARNSRTKNSTIGKKLLNFQLTEKFYDHVLNTSSLQNLMASKTVGIPNGHAQATVPAPAPRVNNHVRLQTASVTTTVNGTSVSSLMGVIRDDSGGHSDGGLYMQIFYPL